MNSKLKTLFYCLLSTYSFSQETYQVVRNDAKIIIDGVLDELIWKKATEANNFTTNYPKFGNQSRFKSKMYLVYDDDAIYIGALLDDPAPDSVMRVLSTRDDNGNADWAGILIDTYGQGLNGFGFAVTAAGVETDGLINDTDFDQSWNAVWKSEVKMTATGWAFEMRIPLAAIRFSKESIQKWKINFVRNVRREREQSYLFPVDPEKYGEIAQNGPTSGIENIKSPLRLSINPYFSTYAINSFNDETKKQEWGTKTTGGLDLKYGLSQAFTLDMSLIPDFGQTISDQRVLNVSPFEVKYNENRSFFTEGTDLFSIGNVFYSRRIGGEPYNAYKTYDSLKDGDRIISDPSITPLLNATKVSGRTEKGLGIGFFNAIVGKTKSIIEDSNGIQRQIETNPLTNYNVFVLSQNLKNNSTVSLLNTNTVRAGNTADANVTVGEINLYTPDLKYFGASSLKVSNIMNGKNNFGHSMYIAGGKAIGKLITNSGYYEESDTYEVNDLGFLQNNNTRGFFTDANIRFFQPRGRYVRRSINFTANYDMLFKPALFSNASFTARLNGTTRKFLSIGTGVEISSFTIDHFESRTFGKPIFYPGGFNYNAYYSSDYSKKFALDVRGGVTSSFDASYNYLVYEIIVSPRFRFSDKCFLIVGAQVEKTNNEFGYIRPYDDVNSQIILGTRDRINVTNTINLDYIFTNRMSANLIFRHYWSQIEYKGFSRLDDRGLRAKTSYDGVGPQGQIHDISYNAFTVDASYQWVFYPGARLSIAWKNNIFNYKNALESGYFGTFNSLFKQAQVNSLSLRAIFFVDALWLKKIKKK
jgi:hypothetical protein